MRLKYDLAKILERYVLISYSRITQSQLPEGLFKYDLRSGGELEFATLEKSVFVNHSASIICSEPFELGNKGYIEFFSPDAVEFCEKKISIHKYIKKSKKRKGTPCAL